MGNLFSLPLSLLLDVNSPAALAVARVPSLGLSLGRGAGPGAGVDLARLLEDEAVLDELADVLA